MATQTRAQLAASTSALLSTSAGIGSISPDDLAGLLLDYNDSMVNPSTDTASATISGSIAMTSAEILAAFATPKTIIASVSGKTIQLISCSIKTAAGSAYATNLRLDLRTNSAAESQYKFNDILAGTTIVHRHGIQVEGTTTQLLSSRAIECFAPAGNPITGNFDVTIYFSYILI